MTVLWLRQDLNGSILDVGGGGEGVIGRLYGQSVTAIDNCREELDEAPCGCRKLVMDASRPFPLRMRLLRTSRSFIP